MRDCVLSFVAAIGPAATVVGAPVIAPLPSQFFTRTPSPTDMPSEAPTFRPDRAAASLPPVTADAANEASVVFADDFGASRTIAYWSALDLDMLALRDRVESSPLLRDGLTLGTEGGLIPTEILALSN